jgi:hypothetical protein
MRLGRPVHSQPKEMHQAVRAARQARFQFWVKLIYTAEREMKSLFLELVPNSTRQDPFRISIANANLLPLACPDCPGLGLGVLKLLCDSALDQEGSERVARIEYVRCLQFNPPSES